MNPIHNADLYYQLPGYNRIRVVTEYIDMGMGDRKPADYYYGALSSPNYASAVSSRKYVKYGKPDMGLSKQSRVDSSLTSKSKTRGKKQSKKPYTYRPSKGERCKKGYTAEYIMGVRMCVKQ